MAANRIPANAPLASPTYAVVGMYSATAGNNFVQHVAVLRSAQSLSYAMQNVPVWHMGPPLVAGAQSLAAAARGRDLCPEVHVIGYIGDLGADEIEGIETWLADVDKEKRPTSILEQYFVDPPVQAVRSENGTVIYRRFSCTGFVVECYRFAGITLVDWQTGQLPQVDLATICAAFPFAQRDDRRSACGIDGAGPWRILLAGYLFHSMNRPDVDVRSTPHNCVSLDEARFP